MPAALASLRSRGDRRRRGALHAQAPTPDASSTASSRLRARRLQWLDRILPFAQRTFALLATLELAISGLFWALGREGLDAIAAALLKKFIVIAFLFSLLTAFPLWLPSSPAASTFAGQTAAGVTAANPPASSTSASRSPATSSSPSATSASSSTPPASSSAPSPPSSSSSPTPSSPPSSA